MYRAPEQPTWTLMLTSDGDVVAVRQEDEQEKVEMDWTVVARESDLLPFNPPQLIFEHDDWEECG